MVSGLLHVSLVDLVFRDPRVCASNTQHLDRPSIDENAVRCGSDSPWMHVAFSRTGCVRVEFGLWKSVDVLGDVVFLTSEHLKRRLLGRPGSMVCLSSECISEGRLVPISDICMSIWQEVMISPSPVETSQSLEACAEPSQLSALKTT